MSNRPKPVAAEVEGGDLVIADQHPVPVAVHDRKNGCLLHIVLAPYQPLAALSVDGVDPVLVSSVA